MSASSPKASCWRGKRPRLSCFERSPTKWECATRTAVAVEVGEFFSPEPSALDSRLDPPGPALRWTALGSAFTARWNYSVTTSTNRSLGIHAFKSSGSSNSGYNIDLGPISAQSTGQEHGPRYRRLNAAPPMPTLARAIAGTRLEIRPCKQPVRPVHER